MAGSEESGKFTNNVDEFSKFHTLLTENAPEGYKPFYFRCAESGKEPDVRYGSWKKNPLSFKEACEWLIKGGNVGISGRDDDQLLIIDIDDENITDYKTLQPTLTARSGGRRGVHLFRFVAIPGAIPNIPTEDAGEVRTINQYVIAPGSYVKGYSFKIDSSSTTELNKEEVSSGITAAFKTKGHDLSGETEITKEGENKWNINHKTDRGIDKYIARIEDKSLIVYVGGIPGEREIPRLGQYTVEVEIPVHQDMITLSELPPIFLEQLNKNREAKREKEKRKEKKANRGDVKESEKRSAFFDLTVHDIIASVENPQERFPSLFHGSDTGKNTSISGELLHCWRHSVSLNAQQICSVLSGALTCEEAGSPHKDSGASVSQYIANDEALFQAWKYAKENNFIPNNDPIPIRALVRVAIKEEFCKEEDVEDGWKLPSQAYNKVIGYLKKEGIEPGRCELEQKARETKRTKDKAGGVEEEHIKNIWQMYINKAKDSQLMNPNPTPLSELFSGENAISFSVLEREETELGKAILKNAKEAIEIGNVVLYDFIKPLKGYIRFTSNNEGGKKLDEIAENIQDKNIYGSSEGTGEVVSTIVCEDYIIRDEKTGEPKGIDCGGIAYKLAELYNAKTISGNKNSETYLYKDGIYKPEGVPIIKAKCEELFENVKHLLTSYRINEIIGHLQRKTHTNRKELNSDEWKLNLKNGIFDIKTMSFTPHTPDLFTTIRIPITYDENAKCPLIEKFITEVVFFEDKETIEEMIGYCLYHKYPFQSWFLLYGGGGNGKSVLIALITHFLGEENIASVGLQELQHRFAAFDLYGRSANLVADLSDSDLKRTNILKALTGGDTIRFEQKGRDGFTDRSFAKLIYSCNKIPMTQDNTDAFFERVILVPFPYKFRGSEHEDKFLLDKLTTEEEKSGLFNLAIAALKRLIDNRAFWGAKGLEEAKDNYQRLSNPVYCFFEDMCVVSPELYIAKPELYEAFEEYCTENRLNKRSEKVFIAQMKLLTKMDEERMIIGSKRPRVWIGLDVRKNMDEMDEVSTMSTMSTIFVPSTHEKGGENVKETVQKGENTMDTLDTLAISPKNDGPKPTRAVNIDDVNEKPTPKSITTIIREVGKCKECGKGEIDLIHVVFYSNGEFKYVCEACGQQIMKDYGLKLIGGDKQ